MLSSTQIETLKRRVAEHRAGKEPKRVFVTRVDDRSIFIKQQEGSRPIWRYAMLSTLSFVFREPLARPAKVPGGEAVQAMEVKRLTDLADAGVSVPELLHVDQDWIALSCLNGLNLRELHHKGEKPPSFYFEHALVGIVDTHKKGQSLSQAFNRNVMWDEDNQKIVFIDFEDEPSTYLGMTMAQGRDWLFFLYSAIWMQEISNTELTAMIWRYLQQEIPEIQKIVLRTGTTIGWMRRLSSNRKRWGRDIISLQRWGQVLHDLQKLAAKETA